MAERKHRTHFDITATDRATQVFQTVGGGLDTLKVKYLGIAAAAAEAFQQAAFVVDAVRYRSTLDDLADTTGDNVRTLDAMARQARVSGIEVSRLGDILTLFARNLNAADDEGTAAAQAIEAIGLSVQDLRAMNPGEALFAIAKALSQYGDGQSKVAVANALAKGSARDLLPYLKDLAEAGELNGKVTKEQAEQAERLEKEWRKLKLAFDDSKDSIATSLIPWLTKLVEQGREGIKVFGGFWSAFYNVGWGIDPMKSPRENIADMQQEVAALEANRARRVGIAGFDSSFYDKRIETLQKRIDFAKFMERQNALALAGPDTLDARDLALQQKPRLNFVPQKAGAAAKEEKSPRLTPEKIAQMQAAGQEEFNEQIQRWQKEQIEAEKKFNDELQKTAEHYRELIDPLRKYSKEWEKLDELLRLGVLTEQEYLDAYVKVAAAADKARLEVEGLGGASKDTKNAFAEMGFVSLSALEQIILKGGQASDIIRALGQDLARILLRKKLLDPLAAGAGELFDGLFGGSSGQASTGDFSAGGGFEGVDWGSVGGFATGGSFTVGGRGGTDSQLVAFRATPGERVEIAPPGKQGRGGDTFIIDARGADREGLMRLESMIRSVNGSIERRSVMASAERSRR